MSLYGVTRPQWVNSCVPWEMLLSCETFLRWMPKYFTDDNSRLKQAQADPILTKFHDRCHQWPMSKYAGIIWCLVAMIYSIYAEVMIKKYLQFWICDILLFIFAGSQMNCTIFKPLIYGDRVISVQLGQYHGCRCPGDTRSQDISTHDIDYVE